MLLLVKTCNPLKNSPFINNFNYMYMCYSHLGIKIRIILIFFYLKMSNMKYMYLVTFFQFSFTCDPYLFSLNYQLALYQTLVTSNKYDLLGAT